MPPNTQFRDSTPDLVDFDKGERPTAMKHNNSVQTLRSLTQGVAPPRQIFQSAGGTAATVAATGTRLEVLEYGRASGGAVDDTSRATYLDHIICRRETVDDQGVSAWTEMMIAKPLHLQAQNAIRMRTLDRPGQTPVIELEYGDRIEDIGGDQRIATNRVTGDQELQIITPSYAHGDLIEVERVGVAITGVTVVDEGFADERAGFIDVNGDGSPVPLDLMDRGQHREWCHPPTTTPRPEL